MSTRARCRSALRQVAVKVRLRLEREGVERLQHREAGVLDAALDAAFPACGHLQVHQLRQVVGRRLTLTDGLLGQGLPLRCDRRQAQRLQVGGQVRRLGNRGGPSASAPPPARHKGTDQIPCGKYTPRAQLRPLGAPEPASGRRETGGGGRPARLCQEETHVLAEQFGTSRSTGNRSARGAPAEPWSWNSRTSDPRSHSSAVRATPGSLWRAPGRVRAGVRRRTRRPVPPSPLTSVILHESGRYPHNDDVHPAPLPGLTPRSRWW